MSLKPFIKKILSPLKFLENLNSDNKVYTFFSNCSWIAFSFICLIISYLVIWKRGLYSDDYTFRVMGINPISGEIVPWWDLPNDHFPMRILAWIVNVKTTGLVPDYEILVRIAQACFITISALLLSILIYQIIRSKLAAVIGGWLYIVPIFSSEAVLWITTILYVVGCSLAILSVNFIQLAAQNNERRLKYLILSALVFVLMMITFEGCMTIIGVMILISYITYQAQNLSIYESIKQTVLNTTHIFIIFGIIILIFRKSPLIADRGGMETNILVLTERIIGFFERTYWMTFSSDWGRKLLEESFIRGYNVLFSSFWTSLFFIAAVLALSIAVISWKNKESNVIPNYKIGVMLLIAGILWTIFSILIPSVFSKGQILEYRMLYFPTAGLCLTIASVFWLISKLTQFNQIISKVLIAITGLATLSGSILMLGYSQLFAERSKIDQEQLLAVSSLLPNKNKISANTTFVFYKFDENSNFDYPTFSASNRLLFGVFETTWTANDSLKTIYKRTDLTSITQHRWGNWDFKFDQDQNLLIQGKPISLQNTLFITYRNQNICLVNQLILESKDGVKKIFEFPLAEKFRNDGIKVMQLIEKIN